MSKVYGYVTERIYSCLSKVRCPEKPENGLPINYTTRKPYRGVNLSSCPVVENT